jgi:hypothetical protein
MKEIKFTPNAQDVDLLTQPPLPAKKNIPDWYKKSENFNVKKPIFNNGQIVNKGLKMCMPFLDTLISGYIQYTWTDIFIERNMDGSVNFSYAMLPQILDAREKASIPVNDMYNDIEFIWKTQWRISFPKDYSVLITHPFNRLDLPFTTLSGIIDYSPGTLTGGSLPFYLKKDFEGLIPAGTPMFQIVPIKRESWKSEVLPFNRENHERNMAVTYSRYWGAYKDLFWRKKDYS